MKYFVFFASFLCLNFSAYSADDTEVKFGGDFRLRYENFRNPTAVYQANDGEAHVNHRFRLNADLRKGENLTGGLTLIHAAEWGSHSGTAVSSLNSTGTGDTDDGSKNGVGDAQNMLLVNRAWGAWKYNNNVNFQFGRVSIAFGDGTIMADNDWEQTPTSHDGFIANWEVNFGKFEFFAVKSDEFGNGYITHDAERNLYGITFNLKSVPEWIKILNASFVQVTQDERGTGADSNPAYLAGADVNEERVSATFQGDKGLLFYRLSGAYVFGQANSNSGGQSQTLNIAEYMIDSSLALSLNSAQSFKVAGGFHYDSGSKNRSATDVNGYESFYYDIHDHGGFMDVVRWGNLTTASGSVIYNPTEDIELSLNYYHFTHSVVSDSGTALATAATPTQFGPEYKTLQEDPAAKEIGQELDFIFKKSFDNGLKFQAVAASFDPGSALTGASDPKQDRLIFEYFAQASIEF